MVRGLSMAGEVYPQVDYSGGGVSWRYTRLKDWQISLWWSSSLKGAKKGLKEF